MIHVIVTNDSEMVRLATERGAVVFITEKFSESVEPVEKANASSDVVYDLLRALNIKPNIKGYHYIKFMMERCENNPTYHTKPITKEIYPECANQFSTTPNRVERAVRHAIEMSFDSDPEKYSEIFGGEFQKEPTNSEFIGLISEYIARYNK